MGPKERLQSSGRNLSVGAVSTGTIGGGTCLAFFFFVVLEILISTPTCDSIKSNYRGKLEYTYGCYSASAGKYDMKDVITVYTL
jgi:hypothetical protein